MDTGTFSAGVQRLLHTLEKQLDKIPHTFNIPAS